mmetsp:Transcript_1088/g.2736  ORF Transcript_1088/g.2736 Transcript_1088/m.2736 type:complete len:148 (+) Transcript_1088:56-499(+)
MPLVRRACAANPVCACAGASLCAFAVLWIMLLGLKDVWPYYLNHLVIALLMFFLFAGIHHAAVYHFKLTDGSWLMGFCASLPFYLSREIRDSEKLGYWDWPGLWWPTIGILILLVVLESGSALWRRSKRGGTLEARATSDPSSGAQA